MAGFLGEKEILTRERVKEILQKKQYSYLEEKVSLLEVRADSLLAKDFFLDRVPQEDDRHRREEIRSSFRSKTSRSRTGATESVRLPISNDRLSVVQSFPPGRMTSTPVDMEVGQRCFVSNFLFLTEQPIWDKVPRAGLCP